MAAGPAKQPQKPGARWWRRHWTTTTTRTRCAPGFCRLRYLEDQPEERVIPELYVCRTTYYRKELEALSTVAIAAARRGLL